MVNENADINHDTVPISYNIHGKFHHESCETTDYSLQTWVSPKLTELEELLLMIPRLKLVLWGPAATESEEGEPSPNWTALSRS